MMVQRETAARRRSARIESPGGSNLPRDTGEGELPGHGTAGYSASAFSFFARSPGSSMEISATAAIASSTVLIGRFW